MKIHHFTVEEALASLRSGAEGLSPREAARRLAEYGPNSIEQVRRKSLPLRFIKGFTHLFAIILWIAAGLALFAEARDPGQGMATLGFAIIGVIIINGIFSFWQEYRAEKAILALQKLLPHQTKVCRDGRIELVPVLKLVPGDLIIVEAGDAIPADCRLIKSFSVRVNNATITGESLPHARDAEPCAETEYIHSRNILLAGTSIVSGNATALVFATGAQTAFGQIARLTQTPKERLSPLQQEITRLSWLVAVLALGLGVIFYFVGRAMGLPFWANFIFAIGIIVANVPEGLLPTVTLALAMGSQRMARRNALVRHLPAVEALGAASVICTDKTGTLTENRLQVKLLWLAGELIAATDAAQPSALSATQPHFFAVASRCHNLKPVMQDGRCEWLGDPLEVALVKLAEGTPHEVEAGSRRGEFPFDSQRRRMSTLHETSEGMTLLTKGAPEVILPRSENVELAGGAVRLDSELRARLVIAHEAMAQQGLRVLALAWRRLPAPSFDESAGRLIPDVSGTLQKGHHLTLAGLVGLEDPPRPEVPNAIQKCAEAGIKVIMVTGDHPHTAVAIAREVGLLKSGTPVIISGEQLKKLSSTQLQLALDAPEILFARVTADQKMRIVTALKRKGEIVAVTGDGVNDAPALKKADIGISMGRCGADVAREASDMILLDDNFATIVAAIEEGRAVYANVRKFLTYILTSNVPELIPYLAFVLLRIPLPLTIIQILAVDLGTDMVPALALGTEPPNPQTMKEPPRPHGERLLNLPLIARAYLWLGLLQAGAAMSAFFFMLNLGRWQYGQALSRQDPLYLRATTACLAAIVVMQIANVFICRSRRQSVFSFGLFSNRLILWGLVVEITMILFICYTPWGNSVFGTAPIPLAVWLFIMPFAVATLALEELRKAIVRGLKPRQSRTGCEPGRGARGAGVHSVLSSSNYA
jgi:sodium/potassium-transporting ATPase subunit alpha